MYTVIEKTLLAPNIYSMKILAPWVARAAQPGQFLIVVLDKNSERIPLTICDYDSNEGSITIVFQVVGKSTKKMEQLNVGDGFADFVGPLGKEAEFLHENPEILKKRKILFVAGGVGIAPVYPQVKWLHNHGIDVDIVVGAKSRNMLILEQEMRAVVKNYYVTTDDGSYGDKGLVTDKIKQLIESGHHYDEVIAIGPMIMMKFVAALTKSYNIPTVVSLNTLMVDGTGMCGACRVTVGNKIQFACVDGPEFDGHLVHFDEAMRRQGMYRTFEIGVDNKKHHCNLSSSVSESNEAVVVSGKKRMKVREQNPDIRNKNFEEVTYGYNEEEAIVEASRCIQCKRPLCVEHCPVNIKIPEFIKEIRERNYESAARILSEDSALAAVCGRVCPQEVQCEGACVLGKKGEPVAIGYLERFAADWAISNNKKFAKKAISNKHKVAVIGSGPSGLTCAGDLAKMGYEVTIYEALHEPGGVLTYGIPEFRLPKERVVKYEIDNIRQLGVKIIANVVIGKSITIDELLEKQGYEAVFIGSGAGLPKFMNIPGENLNGVVSANEILTRSNLMKAYDKAYETPIFVGKSVAVVGGGNVAMDAARMAKRLGADVHLIYRRSEKEMPARVEEVHHAKEEGIHFHFQTNPTAILGDEKGWVRGIRCVKMALGEPDESGRRSFSVIPESEHEIELESVIMSLGTAPNPLIGLTTKGLETASWGGIIAQEDTGATSRPGVFSGGDAVTGAATVILAMGAGKKAAYAIDKYIKNRQKT